MEDRTGLEGIFDIDISFTRPAPPSAAALSEPDATAPPLDVALPQQLGLKFEKTKVAVPALVIDHIEPASEN